MNKPIEYSEEIAAEICERMIEGKGLLQICKDEDMPARGTVYRWLDSRDSFRDRYARAREAQMDYFAELIREIAFDESGDIVLEQVGDKTTAVANHAKVQRDRLKVDSLKWIASKLFGRQYGDRPAEVPQTPGKVSVRWQGAGEAGGINRIELVGVRPPISRIERVIVDPRDDNQTPEQAPERPEEPPRQIAYNPTPPPADLSPEAWSAIARVSELIEQIAPSDETPEHVFGLIEGFLRAHFVASLSNSVHGV
ncbi:hypothetical protein CQ13_32495 [Bradyrhizobium retamae]|uniref:Terminase small subunit protein n=2 Tax=Bradyrhizobium retamae TaxID=1300035 RepID=A0A0R3MRJ5_9BRAD|nr:hypothetical protein CQ13_32495 [Bradyrhizobium retamae]